MGDILNMMNKYGIVQVIIATILYLLFYLTSKHMERKREENLQKAELAKQEAENKREECRREQELQREKALVGMMKELIQGPPHTVEEQREDLNKNEFIMRQLHCLVEEGADRAYWVTFHNGGRDVLGKGFLKMSMSIEDLNEDITPIAVKYQNMPRMLLPKLYEQLDKQDYYNVDNVEDIKKADPFTYQFLMEHSAKTALFRVIKRDDGLIIGFIGMEYIDRECTDFKKASKNIDKKVNRIIGALLGANQKGE